MWMILEARGAAPKPIALVIRQDESFLSDLSARPEFDRLTVLATLPGSAGHEQALARALRESEAPMVAVIGNPALVLDAELVPRIERAAASVTDGDRTAVVTGKGVDQWGNAYSSLYSSLEPHLPYCRSPIPVVDSASDLFIITREHLDSLLSRDMNVPVQSLAGWAVLDGYLQGRVSFFSPHLAAGIYGRDLARDPEAHAGLIGALAGGRVGALRLPALDGAIELGETPPAAGLQRSWRLSPPVDLEQAIRDAILPHCERMSLSIVTRTQFRRPHLLRRLLTSISRWRDEAIDLEVVLSTDVDQATAEDEVSALRQDFPALRLSLAWNGARPEQSRTRNLLGGLEAAGNDYVAFVDDDDHIHFQILPLLAPTRFMGAMPVVFVDTELRNENWVQGGKGRWVLESTSHHHHYPGAGWRTMFQGVNQLPICAAVLPRAWATQALRRFEFRHDYSEDFTMWLLLLEAPDLPLIVDLPRPFCVVSIRNDGTNTVTEQDRSRWVRDISLFLHDLHIAHPLYGEGRLQTAVAAKPSPAGTAARPAGNQTASRLRRELAIARTENEQLRLFVAQMTVRDGEKVPALADQPSSQEAAE